MELEPQFAKGGGEKVALCHWDKDAGAFDLINVSVNAANKHFANHGDVLPGAYYADADGDGYGAGEVFACPAPGLVDNADDCDDTNAAVNPGADEIAGDGIDNNCDGYSAPPKCATVYWSCGAGHPAITFCGEGAHQLSPWWQANASYVTLSTTVEYVTLQNTISTIPDYDLSYSTHLCQYLPSGSNGWFNDRLKAVVIH
jgi:hypothetical protein